MEEISMPRFYSALTVSLVVLLTLASYQQHVIDMSTDMAVDQSKPLQEFGYDFEMPHAGTDVRAYQLAAVTEINMLADTMVTDSLFAESAHSKTDR